jgi:hypothetical protein
MDTVGSWQMVEKAVISEKTTTRISMVLVVVLLTSNFLILLPHHKYLKDRCLEAFV